jgi:hypothetical protein
MIVDSNPDLSVVYYFPNLVTDGKLMMDIELSSQVCFRPGETIRILIIYHNLTDKDLVLVDYKQIARKPTMNAYGQLYPIMTTLDNKEVYPSTYFVHNEAIDPNSPLIRLIPPKVFIEFYGEYQLPKEIGEEDKDHNITLLPLLSGRYLLKLVYIAKEYQRSWYGAISSNQAEICVED